MQQLGRMRSCLVSYHISSAEFVLSGWLHWYSIYKNRNYFSAGITMMNIIYFMNQNDLSVKVLISILIVQQQQNKIK